MIVQWAALVVTLAVGAAPFISAQEMPPVPESAVTAAKLAFEKAMDVSRRTATFDVLGMRSEADSRAAVLGTPIRMLEIGYDQLVAYQPAAPVGSVFVALEQVVFPIRVHQRTRSLLILAKRGNEWQMTSYGDSDRAIAIEAAQNSLSKQKGGVAGPASAFSLLTVPAFQLDMVALKLAQETHVAPLNPIMAAEYGIEGVPELSQAVSRLSTYAKSFDAAYGEQIRQRRLAK
jgi:hypothetical protein